MECYEHSILLSCCSGNAHIATSAVEGCQPKSYQSLVYSEVSGCICLQKDHPMS